MNSDRHLRLYFAQYTGKPYCSPTKLGFDHVGPCLTMQAPTETWIQLLALFSPSSWKETWTRLRWSTLISPLLLTPLISRYLDLWAHHVHSLWLHACTCSFLFLPCMSVSFLWPTGSDESCVGHNYQGESGGSQLALAHRLFTHSLTHILELFYVIIGVILLVIVINGLILQGVIWFPSNWTILLCFSCGYCQNCNTECFS